MTESFNIQALKEGAGGTEDAIAAPPGTGAADTNQQQQPDKKEDKPAEEKPDEKKKEEGAGAGGNGQETPEQKEIREKAEKEKQQQQQETPEAKVIRETKEKEDAEKIRIEGIEKAATKKLLEKYGVSSEEELAEKLNPKAPETEEQKTLNQQKRNLAIHEYAVTNKVMALDEIKKYEEVSKATDEQLALAKYAEIYRTQKKDATDDEIAADFKLFYHTDSEVATVKEAGKAQMKDVADGIRNSLKAKMDTAEASYTELQNKREKIPGFKKAVKESIAANIPNEQSIYTSGKEGDQPVVFKFTDEERAEVEKQLVSEDTFNAYLKDGNSQTTKDLLKDKINGLLFLRNRDKMFSTIYEAGVSAGTKNGSSTGANASFANNDGTKDKPVTVDASDDLRPEDTAKLSSLFGGPR